MHHRDGLMVMKSLLGELADLVSDVVVVSARDRLHALAHLCASIKWNNH